MKELGHKKNSDDEGEGENVSHSEELVGIKNTVVYDTIKVKPEPTNFKVKSYLRRFTRSSSNIPRNVLQTIEKYGYIQNVKPDGNCGFYSVMNGLSHVGIYFEEDVTLYRKVIDDYINKSRKDLLLIMQFRRRNNNKYIETKILDRC